MASPPPVAAASSAPKSSDTARAAGRGGVAVLGAKAFFILSGLVQQTVLPALIGLAGYGALSRVLAVSNVVNNVMVASATQGVSRAVARARMHPDEALRLGLRVHVWLALVAGALFAACAPAIARFEGAPHITAPLATMGGVVACYGVYAALVGALNGSARFSRQAGLDVTFAVLRTSGLLGLGWLFAHNGGSGVLGATIGFVAAAACIVPLAVRQAGLGRSPREPLADVPGARVYLMALVPLAIAQLFTNAVMQVDITLLGRFLSQGAAAAVRTGDADATKIADEWVGVYRACQLFAFLPYQLLFSVTQVLFPYVAAANADGDAAKVRGYVARGARVGAIACGLMVAVIAAMPESLLAFAFKSPIPERGAAALRVLALGQGAFAMLGLAATVLVSLGRERDAAGITLLTLGIVAAGCFGLVPTTAFGEAQLVTTATATSVALVVGLGVAAARVWMVTGTFIPALTALRVGGALAVAIALGSRLPHGNRVVTIGEAIAIAIAYLGVLVVTRELGAEDAGLVRGLVRRKA